MMFLFVLITFKPILDAFFEGFGQIQKSKMAVQDGGHSEMITQLLRHVTSYTHGADVKGDTFRHTIYPPSLVVIAFIFSELRRGGGILPPPLVDQTEPGLNRVKLFLTILSCFYRQVQPILKRKIPSNNKPLQK